LNHINAVIFDMDGLLLDSERISLETFLLACKEFNLEPRLTDYYRCIGTTFVKTKQILTGVFGEKSTVDKMLERWGEIYLEETRKGVPLKTGVPEILGYLEGKRIRKAIVTSTRYVNAVRKLDKSGILHFFEFVIGGDQIKNGKPAPEIYLTACDKIGEKPVNCLALEDSDNGVLSAHAAGLQVIQVPDMLEPGDSIRSLGHPVMKDLFEVKQFLERQREMEKEPTGEH